MYFQIDLNSPIYYNVSYIKTYEKFGIQSKWRLYGWKHCIAMLELWPTYEAQTVHRLLKYNILKTI